ncbi:MAG: T9SS type A sorting domain-containing protein [Bacteroidia bacterium]
MSKVLSQLFLIASLILAPNLYSQSPNFEIILEPISINGLGGIQSYAFGQAEGKWLIIGGRLDGLHQRQPFAAFDIAGHNNQLLVVDPLTQQKWSAPLSSLPVAIQEQLSATNMEFYQSGDYLYCIGGYGYNATLGDHTTFDKLSAIKVPDVINAVINNTDFVSYFRQITDPNFQVTGGQLKKIDDDYYLLGGQKFIGRYNPMGPSHGPGFVQEYTNAIRIFRIIDDGKTISITHQPSHIDSVNLHRRDYNAEPQILPDGSEGITMFSGVFQPSVNLPFLNSVTVDSNGYAVNDSFQQYYNHYHCPTLPFYDASNNEMHTVFFGGIAQFYDDNGTLMQDDNVPFVNTIACVTRDGTGKMTESKLAIVMPTLLGAGAEFIPNRDFPHFDNEVFKLDMLTTDTTLIGYIYGGISSTEANIFFTNNGSQSDASEQIFKVFIKQLSTSSAEDWLDEVKSLSNFKIFPNPNQGLLNVEFYLTKKEDISLVIFNEQGALVEEIKLEKLLIGKNTFSTSIDHLAKGGIYFISLETEEGEITRKLIVRE